MSPTGHKFTGAALAFALAAPLYAAEMYMEAAVIAAGALWGARAPDWSEVAKWVNNKRYSLIPHRGPTHWPGTWLVGLVLSMQYLESPYREIGIGFFASALLHLVMDIMTPTGIPLLHPFQKKKTSFRVYRSGTFLSESALVVTCWAVAAASYLLPWQGLFSH